VAVEDVPIEVVIEIPEDVGRTPLVGFRAVVGEFEFLLVDEDRGIRPVEELQPASMIEVEVALKDTIDLVDRVASLLQIVVEAVFVGILRIERLYQSLGPVALAGL